MNNLSEKVKLIHQQSILAVKVGEYASQIRGIKQFGAIPSDDLVEKYNVARAELHSISCTLKFMK